MKGESITLKQDLIDWLNNKNNITPNTEGLLLAPINNENENFESEIPPVIQNENIKMYGTYKDSYRWSVDY